MGSFFDDCGVVMMAELLPCPFCGGEADLIDFSDEYEGECWVAHQCPSGAAAETYSYETAAEAIAAWNSRYHSEFEKTVIKAWKEIQEYKERTCKNVSDDLCWFECSSCKCTCSVDWWGGGLGEPNYCPNCGAKVLRNYSETTPKYSETTMKVVS